MVVPELVDNKIRAGYLLKGARGKKNMTQVELAKLLAVKQHHLSEMENGKRVIGREMAHKLATFLDTDYKTFL